MCLLVVSLAAGIANVYFALNPVVPYMRVVSIIGIISGVIGTVSSLVLLCK